MAAILNLCKLGTYPLRQFLSTFSILLRWLSQVKYKWNCFCCNLFWVFSYFDRTNMLRRKLLRKMRQMLRDICSETFAPATFAPPTFAPATIAPPTIAPPTVAPPIIAPATFAPVSIAPPTILLR